MKKQALILDFDAKLDQHTYKNFDLIVIDRFNQKIVEIIMNGEEKAMGDSDITFNDFYKQIKQNYQDILCLFLTQSTTNIEDHLLLDSINKDRSTDDAKLYLYLIHAINQPRYDIVKNTISMLDTSYSMRDIIVRNHQIQNEEVFSISDLILKYGLVLQQKYKQHKNQL
jgi:hypothetical protein